MVSIFLPSFPIMPPWFTSKYNPLSSKPPDEDWPEHANDGYAEKALKPTRRLCSLLSMKAILVSLIMILQSGIIIHLHIVASRCQRVQLDVPETFRAQYGGDFRYQSLDHVYDSLWNETDKSVIVMSPVGIEDGHEEIGAITMCVF